MRKLAIFATLSLAFVAACGDDGATPKDAAVPHDGAVDSGMNGPDASCFTNPHTNDEIINACTDAQKIYKDERPALQLPDGGLPALP